MLKKMLMLARDASVVTIFIGFLSLLSQIKSQLIGTDKKQKSIGHRVWSCTVVALSSTKMQRILHTCKQRDGPSHRGLLQRSPLECLQEVGFVAVFNSHRNSLHGFGQAARTSPGLLVVTFVMQVWVANQCSFLMPIRLHVWRWAPGRSWTRGKWSQQSARIDISCSRREGGKPCPGVELWGLSVSEESRGAPAWIPRQADGQEAFSWGASAIVHKSSGLVYFYL